MPETTKHRIIPSDCAASPFLGRGANLNPLACPRVTRYPPPGSPRARGDADRPLPHYTRPNAELSCSPLHKHRPANRSLLQSALQGLHHVQHRGGDVHGAAMHADVHPPRLHIHDAAEARVGAHHHPSPLVGRRPREWCGPLPPIPHGVSRAGSLAPLNRRSWAGVSAQSARFLLNDWTAFSSGAAT